MKDIAKNKRTCEMISLLTLCLTSLWWQTSRMANRTDANVREQKVALDLCLPFFVLYSFVVSCYEYKQASSVLIASDVYIGSRVLAIC